VSYLRRVPAGVRYLAALDETGAVRGTAACAVMGDSAGVFFVATHPNWRGRGVGTAMTNAALAAAREDGATVAALDASSTAGAAIYRRLGFQSAGTLTVLTRAIG
jgi:ribosomal protein S18 acetylase RimI-like enzyme